MEAVLLDILKSAPTTGLIIIVLWYGQRGIVEKLDKMSRRMDCFETSQHACQLDFAKSYATKAELHDVESDVANHESRISRLEGRG